MDAKGGYPLHGEFFGSFADLVEFLDGVGILHGVYVVHSLGIAHLVHMFSKRSRF